MFEERDAARSMVGRICASGRAENRAAAEMLVAIDDLYRLRCREDGVRDEWAIDTVEQVAAEVAAALRISHGCATARVSDAIAMRTRLPQVGKVFLGGDIDYFLFGAIVSRTELLAHDPLAAVDAELAAVVARWPSLGRGQRIARVDRVVARHDRDAVRRRKKKRDDRWVDIWDSGDGVSEIRGFLRVMDGRTLDARLDAMAATVSHTIRARQCNGGRTRWARWPTAPTDWPANAIGPTAPRPTSRAVPW